MRLGKTFSRFPLVRTSGPQLLGPRRWLRGGTRSPTCALAPASPRRWAKKEEALLRVLCVVTISHSAACPWRPPARHRDAVSEGAARRAEPGRRCASSRASVSFSPVRADLCR